MENMFKYYFKLWIVFVVTLQFITSQAETIRDGGGVVIKVDEEEINTSKQKKVENVEIPFNNENENENESNYNKKLNLTNFERLKNILEIFDVNNVAMNLEKIAEHGITPNCTRDVLGYVRGLADRKMWAIKMDDASGHYTSGFFYGNNYWMGSMTLCESINKMKINKILQKKSKNTGLPFPATHPQLENTLDNFENAPFQTGFYVFKVRLNKTFTISMIRTVYTGVCFPSSCTVMDMEKLFTSSQSKESNDHLKLIEIRVPTAKTYKLFEDKVFWSLMIISSTVFLLIITGTIYGEYLKEQRERELQKQEREIISNSESSSGIGCAASDCSEAGKNDFNKTFKDLNIVQSVIDHSCGVNVPGELHEPKNKKPSVWSEILLSFSIITNFKAICDRNVGPDTIPSFHGLKAFSMAWIILGHTCIVIFKYSDNMEKRKEVEQNFFFQAITNGPYSVDTFFYLSGVLVSYIYFRTNAKGNLNNLTKGTNELTTGLVHFTGLVGYRFVRLTAPYMYVLFVVQVTMKYLDAYSIFEPPTMDHINCPNYWWRNLLYINTLFSVDQMCMLWSWYLANDTQFYIIGAIILIIAVRHFKLASITMLVFLVSSWITTAVIAFRNNHMPNTDDPLALFDKIYDKPWTRFGPYLIGMSVGWILFKTNCKIRFSKIVVAVAWTIAILNLLILVFGLHKTELSQMTAAAFSSLSHSAWAMSLAWITIACSTGYGGPVNSILSAPCLYPFSRVTYCAYLVHPIVIRTMALSSDSPMHLGAESMIVTFFGLVVCSWLLSFVVSLSFEAPVVTMLKLLTPKRRKIIEK